MGTLSTGEQKKIN